MERRFALLFGLVVALLYANSLDGGYHFDDDHVLEQNPAIRRLANVPRFFVDPSTTTVLPQNQDLRPVLLATFALNHAISGERTWSYHVLNIVLHWLAVVLVFRIVRDHLWLGTEGIGVAAAAALIVAAHPLNTEPVDYLSARSALLTTVLYLGAFDAALRERRLASLLLFALALLTKAIAVTLPLLLLAHHLVGRRCDGRRPDWPLLGALAVLAVGGIAYRAFLLPSWIRDTAHEPDVTPRIYLMTEWSAYLYYLRLFVWPNALVVDRLDYALARSILEPRAWASLLALAGLGALAWRAGRRRPAVRFAALWYVLTLAPESTVFALAEPVNEHRPYLAMLGLGTLSGLALHDAATVLAWLRGCPVGPVLAAFCLVVAGGLGAVTVARNQLWRDDYLLWLDATVKAPDNARAWLNAGHAAMVRGDDAAAGRLLGEAHRRSPCYAYVLMNLSALAARGGQPEESLRWAENAVLCNPRLALTHFYQANALERLGRLDDALEAYRATTDHDPHHAAAWLAQGRLEEQRGRWAAAATAYDQAFAADPTNAEAAMLAGLLYHYRLGDSARAIARYRTVLRLNPTHYGAHYQLAVALLAAGDRPAALVTWQAFERLATAIGDRASIERAPPALRTP